LRVVGARTRAVGRYADVAEQKAQQRGDAVRSVETMRQMLGDGVMEIPRVGGVLETGEPGLPSVVVDCRGVEVEPVSEFLRDLMLCDMRAGTCRSYAHDLLRWFRLLWLLGMGWERATTSEVALLVGWLRSAPNPQRRRSSESTVVAGEVNMRTGKPTLRAGYSRSTINHALTVVSQFYAFHAHAGRGPVVNPVPERPDRRRALAHRSPIDPVRPHRRAPLRQRVVEAAPRSIPDAMWDELFAAVGNDRDRALLELFVSTAARAEELLGLGMDDVDWAGQRIWVVSKGSRLRQLVPASPQGLVWLARYLHAVGPPPPGTPIWRTMDRRQSPLTYAALRRTLQRANDRLGTNWTAHDLRHTAAMRMAADPSLTVVDVQTVLRHRHLTSTQRYFRPRIDEVIDKLHDHFDRPQPPPRPAPGYAAEDLRVVFGG
jgi:integrase